MRQKISGVVIVAVLGTLFGCATSLTESKGVSPMQSEESLGLRKTTIYQEETTTADKTAYTSKQPGESSKIERAFLNAPPMIPHSTEGLLPIETNNNACLGCHMPEIAEMMEPKPTPIPKTHFTNWRPHSSLEGNTFKTEADVMHNKTFSKSLSGLNNNRYVCTSCHAPQSVMQPVVKNTFSADFSDETLKHRSNLVDVVNEGIE